MSELISKDAALDCFCDWIDRYGNEHTADEDATYQRIAELPAAQPETHWIPCSERLPEEGQKCLVYDKAIGFRVDTYIGHGNPYNWELFVRDYEAWIPIPKLTGGDVE